MVTSKDRRHSGRKTTVIYHPKEEPYEITYWDDWSDYRDSQRNGSDRSLIKSSNMYAALYFNVERDNIKNKLLLKRRKIKKNKLINKK